MTTAAPGQRNFWIGAGVALLVLGGLALGVRFLMYPGTSVPSPPPVELQGVDPAVAAAVRAAEQRVRQTPRSAANWGLLGKVLLANDFFPEAQVALQEAERLDPREPRWPYLLASIDRWTNPVTEAKLRRAVELCGDNPPNPRLRLAEWLLSRDRFEEAEAEFSRSLTAVPDNVWARLGLVRVALERGDARRALARLDEAPSVRDMMPHAYHDLRAQIAQQLGDANTADQEARLLRTLPPDAQPPDPFAEEVVQLAAGLDARLKLAEKLRKEGRTADELHLLQELAHDYPEAETVWLRLGQALQAQGDLENAEKAAQTAVRRAPTSVEAQYLLGLLLFQKGKTAEAVACFRRTTELEPAFAPGYLHLALCLERQGDQAGARAALQAAVRYAPQVAGGHLALGQLLLRAGQKTEAAAQLRDAVRLEPDNAKARQLLEQLDGGQATPPG